jgi:hypothetical protein
MAWSSEEVLARVSDCSWPSLVDLWGALYLSRPESWKLTLVDCSCHWVTSLVGRFLWCPSVGLGVWYILATKPPSVGQPNEDVACWQASEPRDKSWCHLLVFILWLILSCHEWYNHPTHLPCTTLFHTCCSLSRVALLLVSWVICLASC